MRRLTNAQIGVLRFIAANIRDRGYPPTLREVMAQFGYRSTNAVSTHYAALQRKGMLSDYDPSGYTPRGSRSRGIRLTPTGRFWCGDMDRWCAKLPSAARGLPVNVGTRCKTCGAQTFAPELPCPMCGRAVPVCTPSLGRTTASVATPGAENGVACS